MIPVKHLRRVLASLDAKKALSLLPASPSSILRARCCLACTQSALKVCPLIMPSIFAKYILSFLSATLSCMAASWAARRARSASSKASCSACLFSSMMDFHDRNGPIILRLIHLVPGCKSCLHPAVFHLLQQHHAFDAFLSAHLCFECRLSLGHGVIEVQHALILLLEEVFHLPLDGTNGFVMHKLCPITEAISLALPLEAFGVDVCLGVVVQ